MALILIGRTERIRDRTNNEEYYITANVQVNIGIESLSILVGKRAGSESIPWDKPVTGVIGWSGLSPNLLAAHTGDTPELGSGQNQIDELDIAALAATCEHLPLLADTLLLNVGGTEYAIVAGGAEVAGVSASVDLVTGVITFGAGETANECEAEYVGLDTTAGYRVEISPYAYPTEIDMVLVIDAAQFGDPNLGNAVMTCNNVQLMGAIEMGVEVGGNYTQFSREFNVANRNKGDVIIRFPEGA